MYHRVGSLSLAVARQPCALRRICQPCFPSCAVHLLVSEAEIWIDMTLHRDLGYPVQPAPQTSFWPMHTAAAGQGLDKTSSLLRGHRILAVTAEKTPAIKDRCLEPLRDMSRAGVRVGTRDADGWPSPSGSATCCASLPHGLGYPCS